MEIDIISKQEVEQIALNTVCDYIKPEEWCEEGSIRQDIKDIKEHLDRHKSWAWLLNLSETLSEKLLTFYERGCG